MKRIGKQYVMVCESHLGTRAATSPNGIEWHNHGLWITKSGSEFDAFGQVTPCLLVWPDHQEVLLYFGAAAAAGWDHNTVAVHLISTEELTLLIEQPGK